MPKPFRQSDLEAYLDEALPPEQMVRIERALRKDAKLRQRLAATNARRDAGVHSLGEIWRRHRLSCPSRQQLGSYLLDALPDEQAEYITFHLEVIGCRYCMANLSDLESRDAEAPDAVQTRRRKYFQSSVGHLRRG